ncbi:MAG: hypothetical protein KGJ07_01525 [Patescibacteria group bacterium]|nr:hypothetical protein [Patescibacteria group bacterium]
MATYAPAQVGIQAPAGGFQNGGWYGGRQFWNGQLGEVNQIINPNQQGSGGQVSQEVQNQSAAAQGITPQQFGNYLTQQATKAGTQQPTVTTGSNQAGADANAAASGLGTPGTGTAPTSDAVTAAQAKITTLQNQITAKQQAAADAQKTENDNPFYSESTRVGRVQKITDALNADLTPLNQELAAAQANYDTAVKAATPNNEVVQSTDANGNLTLLTIDKNTGAIVGRQTVPGVGKQTGASTKFNVSDAVSQMEGIITNHLNSYGNISPQDWQKALAEWLAAGGSQKDFVNNFGQYADTNRGDFEAAYGFSNPNPTWAGSTYIGKDTNKANNQGGGGLTLFGKKIL